MYDGAAAGRPAPARAAAGAWHALPCGPWAAPRRRAEAGAKAAGRRWPEGWREGADRRIGKPCRGRIVSCLATRCYALSGQSSWPDEPWLSGRPPRRGGARTA